MPLKSTGWMKLAHNRIYYDNDRFEPFCAAGLAQIFELPNNPLPHSIKLKAHKTPQPGSRPFEIQYNNFDDHNAEWLIKSHHNSGHPTAAYPIFQLQDDDHAFLKENPQFPQNTWITIHVTCDYKHHEFDKKAKIT